MPPNPSRRLVLDEDMNWKFARELRERGMLDATSVYELGYANQGVKDGALIKKLATEHDLCVLVAWDNRMTKGHRQELLHFGLTLAVIDKHADRGGLNDEQYYRDVIHRHAHRIGAQAPGSAFKYRRRDRPVLIDLG